MPARFSANLAGKPLPHTVGHPVIEGLRLNVRRAEGLFIYLAGCASQTDAPGAHQLVQPVLGNAIPTAARLWELSLGWWPRRPSPQHARRPLCSAAGPGSEIQDRLALFLGGAIFGHSGGRLPPVGPGRPYNTLAICWPFGASTALDPVQRALIWVAFNIRLGRLDPYILGLALWRRAWNRSPEERP